MRLIVLLLVLVVAFFFSYVVRVQDQINQINSDLEYYLEQKQGKFQNKLDVMCCIYRQHYHDCFSAINRSGCVLGTANVGEVPPTILCSRNNGCDAPMSMPGYFLSGFEWNCEECESHPLVAPYVSYWEASRYPPQFLKTNMSEDEQYADYA